LSPHPTARTIGYGIISTKTFGKPVIPFRVQRNLDGADTTDRHGLRPLDQCHDLVVPRLRHRASETSFAHATRHAAANLAGRHRPSDHMSLGARTHASSPGLSASVTYNSLLHNVQINTRSTIPGQTRWVLARVADHKLSSSPKCPAAPPSASRRNCVAPAGYPTSQAAHGVAAQRRWWR